MDKRRLAVYGALSVLVSGLSGPSSHALSGQVGLGAGYPIPLTSAQLALNRAVSYEAEFVMDDALLAPGLHPKITAFYVPLTVRNLTNGLLHMGGATIGLQTQGPGFWRLSPFFSLGVGGVFESLLFTNAASAFAHSAVVPLVQMEGGLDIGIVSKLGIVLKAPVQLFLNRSFHIQWSGIALLRWQLG